MFVALQMQTETNFLDNLRAQDSGQQRFTVYGEPRAA